MGRHWIKGMFITLAGLALAGVTQAQTLKIATLAPDGTTWMNQMRECADRITQETGGRVKLKFYPGGVMGNSDTVRRKMRVGQLHGGAFTGGELAETYPDFYLYSLPFLFRDEDEVQYVRRRLDGPLAEGLERKGMVLLGLSGGGFVYLMSDHEVDSIEKLRASKVWVPEGDVVSEIALREVGVAPIPIPLSDVYTALQTGVIDTVLNTPVGSIAFQWHTRTRFLTDFPVAYVIGVMAVDARAFGRLSDADQEVVKREVKATFARLDEINRGDNIDARDALRNQGIDFQSLDRGQLPMWRDVGSRTIGRLKNSDLEFEHLDALVKLLEDYRNSTAMSQ